MNLIRNSLDRYIAQYVQANKLSRPTAVALLYKLAFAAHSAAQAWEE